MTKDTIRLGSISGIPVGTNPSLLLVLLGGPWYLAAVILGPLFPELNGVSVIAISLLSTLGFLGSILAHELGHALVARGHGIPVEGISLAWFGGAARLGGVSPSPEAEFRIAFAGPAMNIALTVVLGSLAGLSAMTDLGRPITLTLTMLAGANLIMLALFNLLPAVPFDGGRILTAMLWKRTGDRAQAITISSWLGIAAGLAFCAFGWWSFVKTDHPIQLIYLAIGAFVLINAKDEMSHAKARRRLRDFTTAEVMTPTPPMVQQDHTVASALHATGHLDRHAYAVVDALGTPTGIVSAAQLRAVPPWERGTTAVSNLQVTLADMPSAFPTDDLETVAHRLFESPTRVLAVGDGSGRVLGTVELKSVIGVLEGPSDDTPVQPGATVSNSAGS